MRIQPTTDTTEQAFDQLNVLYSAHAKTRANP